MSRRALEACEQGGHQDEPDHYGGAQYLKDEYGAPVLMSAADWDALADDISLPYFVRTGYPPVVQPERDVAVEDGEFLSLGNASVRFVLTPGHTPGTLSPIIEGAGTGADSHRRHVGGQALHDDLATLSQVHNSLHKFWRLGRERGVEGLISTHAWFVGNFEQHARGRVDGRNPLLIGQDGFERMMGIYDACIDAQFARSHAKLE